MKNKWRDHFFAMTTHVASLSKDPSTKVGAVIVDNKRRIVGTGYNGFPRGVYDGPEVYEDRDAKLARVVHAEVNAILNARGPVDGCDLYVTPLHPCNECTKVIIQAGIKRVFTVPMEQRRYNDTWRVAMEMFEQAGVEIIVCE
jgi:dCMP deaminase